MKSGVVAGGMAEERARLSRFSGDGLLVVVITTVWVGSALELASPP